MRDILPYENKKNIKIIGNRIRLEIFKDRDVNLKYQKWINDTSLTKYIEKAGANITIDDLKKFVSDLYNSNNDYFFRIIELEKNSHIGNVRIGPIEYRKKTTGFGIIIGDKNYLNKGYASEVFQLILNFCKKNSLINEIKFDCAVDNIYAMKIYQNFNCKMELSDEKLKKNGKLLDKVIFSKKLN